jgi:hypothetical protein
VGILLEGGEMYTGTLIEDLMAVVKRVEQAAHDYRLSREMETRIFAWQGSRPEPTQEAFAGAA